MSVSDNYLKKNTRNINCVCRKVELFLFEIIQDVTPTKQSFVEFL